MKNSSICLIFVTGVCIFFAVVILWAMISAYGPHMVEPPEFSFVLVDNGENDYIDIKLINPGGHSVPIRGDIELNIVSEENKEIAFTLITTLPNMFPGDNLRIFFGPNGVEKGKMYGIYFTKAPFWYPIRKTIVCE